MITAHDWTTNTTIDPAIWERWPDYRVWLVAADDVDASQIAAMADDLFRQATSSASAAEEVDGHVLRWQDAYQDFGVKPRVARSSVDALLRRAGSDNGLPRINGLVDVYNAISILHRVPIGGEDLDRYEGPARLLLASGQTTRTAIDPDTRRLGFIIDSLDAPHHAGARAAADQLAALVGNAHVRMIEIAGGGSC